MKLQNPNSVRMQVLSTSPETWHFTARVRDRELGAELAQAHGSAHDGLERLTVEVKDPFSATANRQVALKYTGTTTDPDGASVDVFEADVFMSSRYGNNPIAWWGRVDTNVGAQYLQDWGESYFLPPRRS